MSLAVSRRGILCSRRRDCAGFERARPHRHSGVEVIYCESGEGTVWVDGTEMCLTPGVALLFPGSSLHLAKVGEEYVRWNLCFLPALSDGLDLEHLGVVAAQLDARHRGRISRIFHEIEEEMTERRGDFHRYVHFLLEQLLILISRGNGRGRPIPVAPMSLDQGEVVKAILAYIDAHLDEEVTVERLAGTFHYAPGHIWRLIRHSTGYPPLQYINRRRLQRARSLLKETDDAIGLIAEKVGFRSGTYFSRLFKSEWGCTPREYRLVSNPRAE